jgi:hypothetical protein
MLSCQKYIDSTQSLNANPPAQKFQNSRLAETTTFSKSSDMHQKFVYLVTTIGQMGEFYQLG